MADPASNISRAPKLSAADPEMRRHDAGSELRRWIREAMSRGEIRGGPSGEAIAAWMDLQIREALHSGHLRAGARLPSLREITDLTGATQHAAIDAYRRLEAAGLVETRDRSGTYVAQTVADPGVLPSESIEWLVEVLGQAVEHRLRVPQVPDLIRKWVLDRPLRCACVESAEDPRFSLCAELRETFGLGSVAVDLEDLPVIGPGETPPRGQVPDEVCDSDIVVSTSFHAARLRPIAEALGKPLVVTTIHPDIAAAIQRKLDTTGELVLICVDPAFGERVRSGLRGGLYHDHIRVVLAHDAATLATLNRADPVYLTRAARECLGARADFRLVALSSPTFSPDFARALLTVVARLHQQPLQTSAKT